MKTPAIKSQNNAECILGVRKIFLQQKKQQPDLICQKVWQTVKWAAVSRGITLKGTVKFF